jgi:ribosomal protein S27E
MEAIATGASLAQDFGGQGGQGISISCTKCRALLSADSFAAASTVACPSCGTLLTAFLFPALSRNTISNQAPEALLTDTEASCFFHPAKKAVVTCAGCGRFLCGLCDLDWQGQHLCSACLEAGKKKGKMKNLENHRVLYDQIALSIAVVPVIFWFITFITAPIALYVCVRYWKNPGSLVSASKFRFLIAILFAVGELAGWAWFIALIFHVVSK